MRTKSFDDVDRALDQLKSQLPKAAILDGHQIDDIELTTTTKAVPHKLGRLPRGYVVVRRNSGATFWEEDDANAINLYLQASASITVSLWVY